MWGASRSTHCPGAGVIASSGCHPERTSGVLSPAKHRSFSDSDRYSGRGQHVGQSTSDMVPCAPAHCNRGLSVLLRSVKDWTSTNATMDCQYRALFHTDCHPERCTSTVTLCRVRRTLETPKQLKTARLLRKFGVFRRENGLSVSSLLADCPPFASSGGRSAQSCVDGAVQHSPAE